MRLTHVFETHIHNDYVTGGLALARATGAAYHVNAADEVAFERTPVGDGDVVEVGPRCGSRVLATPGHTFTHLSYALDAPTAAARSGCSPAGRCCSAPPAARTCSARSTPTTWCTTSTPRRTGSPTELPDDAQVLPTHGFGSFCSATQSEATASTIGQEKAHQPGADPGRADATSTRAAGRAGRLAGLLRAHGPGQRRRPGRAGPDARRSRPTPAELRGRLEAGEWVVDLRTRTAFAAGHVPGTLNFGLDGRSPPTWAG